MYSVYSETAACNCLPDRRKPAMTMISSKENTSCVLRDSSSASSGNGSAALSSQWIWHCSLIKRCETPALVFQQHENPLNRVMKTMQRFRVDVSANHQYYWLKSICVSLSIFSFGPMVTTRLPCLKDDDSTSARYWIWSPIPRYSPHAACFHCNQCIPSRRVSVTAVTNNVAKNCRRARRRDRKRNQNLPNWQRWRCQSNIQFIGFRKLSVAVIIPNSFNAWKWNFRDFMRQLASSSNNHQYLARVANLVIKCVPCRANESSVIEIWLHNTPCINFLLKMNVVFISGTTRREIEVFHGQKHGRLQVNDWTPCALRSLWCKGFKTNELLDLRTKENKLKVVYKCELYALTPVEVTALALPLTPMLPDDDTPIPTDIADTGYASNVDIVARTSLNSLRSRNTNRVTDVSVAIDTKATRNTTVCVCFDNNCTLGSWVAGGCSSVGVAAHSNIATDDTADESTNANWFTGANRDSGVAGDTGTSVTRNADCSRWLEAYSFSANSRASCCCFLWHG